MPPLRHVMAPYQKAAQEHFSPCKIPTVMKANPKLTAEYRRLARYSYKTTVRAAGKRFKVSHGKVDDARKVYPPSAFSARSITRKGRTSSSGSGSTPARWCGAAAARGRVVANQQQEAILKVLLGFELVRAKFYVGHGCWLNELKRYCPVGKRSAANFMRVAERLIPSKHLKFAGPANLNQRPLPRRVVSEIRETIAGRAFEKLYNDLFVSSTPEPKGDAVVAVPKAIAQEACLTGEIPQAHSNMATETAKAGRLLRQALPEEISHLASRLGEHAKAHPKMKSQVTKVQVMLEQGRLGAVKALELLAHVDALDAKRSSPS